MFLQTGIRISIQLKLRHAAGARARAFLVFKLVPNSVIGQRSGTELKTNLSMVQHNDVDNTIHLLLRILNRTPQKVQYLIPSRRTKNFQNGPTPKTYANLRVKFGYSELGNKT